MKCLEQWKEKHQRDQQKQQKYANEQGVSIEEIENIQNNKYEENQKKFEKITQQHSPFLTAQIVDDQIEELVKKRENKEIVHFQTIFTIGIAALHNGEISQNFLTLLETIAEAPPDELEGLFRSALKKHNIKLPNLTKNRKARAQKADQEITLAWHAYTQNCKSKKTIPTISNFLKSQECANIEGTPAFPKGHPPEEQLIRKTLKRMGVVNSE